MSLILRQMESSNPPSPPGANRDPSAEERELVARFKAGDPRAFDRLVCAYQGRVARLAARLLGPSAEINDVVQEVFLSVLVGIKRFRQESGFATWLTTITVNKCRTYAKKQERGRRLMRWLFWARPDYRENNDPQSSSETIDLLCDAVYRLPMSLREPLVLRYFEELSIGEVSQALRISAGAVEVRLTRARQRLKEIMSKSV